MKAAVFLTCCSLAATTAFAQQPRVVNARVSARSAQPDLPRAIAAITAPQVEAAWVGYAVPMFIRDAGGRQGNQDGWSERCRLEQTNVDGAATSGVGASGPIRLEASPTLLVLMRVQNREVQRIRTFSNDCAIDAGGLALYWLDGVDGSQSVAFLKGFVTRANSRDTSDGALAALSHHQDPAASAALLDLAKNSPEARMRERALFWVARSRRRSPRLTMRSSAIQISK